MASNAAKALLAKVVAITHEHADESSYIATSSLSTPLHTEHFDVLSEPDGAFVSPESLGAAVELSKLVNCVQDGSMTYQHPASIGATFVTDVYKQALRDIEFAHVPLSAEQHADYKRAEAILYVDAPFDRTASYMQFSDLRVEVTSQEVDRAETERTLQQANEAEKEVIARRLEEIERALQANSSLLGALDARHGFSNAEEIYQSATVAGFPPKMARAHDMLDDPTFELTNPDNNETHWPASFFPMTLAEGNWIPVKLTRADIARAGDLADDNLPALPQVTQGLELNDEALDLVELEIQVLRVDRPWMWSPLFTNHQWRFRTGQKLFSNGKPDFQGMLPAFVIALIVARNLRLSGRKDIISKLPDKRTTNIGSLVFKRIASHEQHLTTTSVNFGTLSAEVTNKAEPKSIKPMVSLVNNINRVQRVIIIGKTVDNKGNPVKDVHMTARDVKTGMEVEGTSNTKGNVMLRLGKEGKFIVTAAKKGFITFSNTQRFKNGDSFKAVLQPKFVAGFVLAQPVAPQILAATEIENSLTLNFRKQKGGAASMPLDVPVEVVLTNLVTKERHHKTVQAGEKAIFTKLANAKYDVTVHCAVYELIGPPSRVVSVPSTKKLEFTFRSRTILQSEDTFLFGFLCYITPLSPNPNPNAKFED
ncbi:MAG: carboxypeptidase regulatory-like domain-containing protein [Chloroflexi bacterium]|nr:MAG: carboxypeptidase regulatory-like domain-containing protein [Chloroflexota bacterium]